MVEPMLRATDSGECVGFVTFVARAVAPHFAKRNGEYWVRCIPPDASHLGGLSELLVHSARALDAMRVGQIATLVDLTLTDRWTARFVARARLSQVIHLNVETWKGWTVQRFQTLAVEPEAA